MQRITQFCLRNNKQIISRLSRQQIKTLQFNQKLGSNFSFKCVQKFSQKQDNQDQQQNEQQEQSKQEETKEKQEESKEENQKEEQNENQDKNQKTAEQEKQQKAKEQKLTPKQKIQVKFIDLKNNLNENQEDLKKQIDELEALAFDLESKVQSELKQAEMKIKAYQETHQTQESKIKKFKDAIKQQDEDLELTRKRLNKEKEEQKTFAIAKFAKDMLEIQDNVNRAIKQSKELEGTDHTLYEGVILTNKVITQIFNKHGIVQENPLDEKFDPNKHEAIFEANIPNVEPLTIIDVIECGYRIGERQLRYSKVGVARKPQE